VLKVLLYLFIICYFINNYIYVFKGNFEFGISRIIKSLDPYDKKLHTDTWYYAKRCFLALAENMAKHMLIIKDSAIDEIIQFFDKAEIAGEKITTVVGPQVIIILFNLFHYLIFIYNILLL
jgi:tetratricopeptide repeat protein 30